MPVFSEPPSVPPQEVGGDAVAFDDDVTDLEELEEVDEFEELEE
jgi:hypothetical protein